MRAKRPERDKEHIAHVLLRIERLKRFAAQGKDAFLLSEELHDAIERNFEVLGEAASRISDAVRKTHPEVAWRDIIGFRTILAHDYEDVSDEVVWESLIYDLPTLEMQMQMILLELQDVDHQDLEHSR